MLVVKHDSSTRKKMGSAVDASLVENCPWLLSRGTESNRERLPWGCGLMEGGDGQRGRQDWLPGE